MSKTILLTFILSSIFFGLKAQNTEWQTTLEDGFRLGVEENKNVLVEFGVIQDGTPLFIEDEVWSDEVIINRLSSFIPVSIDMTDQLELTLKYNIVFAPTLMLFTPKGDVVFKTEGFVDAFQLDNILETLETNVRKICQLKTVFKDDDALGNLLILEEYMKGYMKAPKVMKNDFLSFAESTFETLEENKSSLDPVQKQRLRIFELLLEQMDFPSEAGIRKMYKIGQKELKASNHSLLLFAISFAEYKDGDEKRSRAVYEELKKRLGTDKQAADYSMLLETTFDF